MAASALASASAMQRAGVATGKQAASQPALLAPALRAAAAFRPVAAGTATARRAGLRVVAQAAAAPAAVAKPTQAKSQYQLQTLTTWLLDLEKEGVIDNELAAVISSIGTACKQIGSLVNRAGISNLTGLAGETNVQGEDQKKLDVISNEVFANCLRSSGRTGVIASEEEDQPVAVEETFSGDYVVVFDPLDGSSNIDAGISVGSIFGIYEPSPECTIEDMDDPEEMMKKCVLNVCQAGNELLCAGYTLYSSATILVLTVGKGVYGFTFDPLIGEYILSHPDIKIPEKGKIYSFNEGNYQLWTDEQRTYIDSLKDPSLWGGKPYSSRYIGSLVGDFHRTLLYGGIYGYPGDSKNPNGKLRLLYECAPMSMICEQAGGKGSTGFKRVLDVVPEKVHQREPLFVGSPWEVDYLESVLQGKPAPK
ncbi:Fructose-1,6-chloroplastic [Micractinium conductrix]|uniref:fructose-bisphosphatase n=1 Tax=Micractinium conductrix TaxID=554055 RepID=A0A2P6V9V3_9CHLO|nr:Fructose-1,6-chloroplastic [Micractinium conductrix]|eukprot:PSC70876.1 Fructose-1,6-chloroplastic [Micractinium conductrix]